MNTEQSDFKFKFIRKIEPIESWLNSYFYLGPLANELYPFWRNALIEDYNNPNSTGFLCSGSERSGKSTYGIIRAIIRPIYERSCILNLPEFFSLSSTTRFKYVWLSATADKAQKSGIEKIRDIFDSIPYFKTVVRRDKIDSVIRFPFGTVVAGGDLSTILSDDTFSITLDESDYIRAAKGEEFEKAATLFSRSRIRMDTTFSRGGKHYGIHGLICSATTTSGFVQAELERARKDNDTYIAIASVYKVAPQKFSSELSEVFIGDSDLPPCIVGEATEEFKQLCIQKKKMSFEIFLKGHKNLIEHVPNDLLPRYRANITLSLQNISGIPISYLSTFFSVPVLDKMYVEGARGIPESITLSLGGDDTFEEFVTDEGALLGNYAGEPVYFGIDLSRGRGDAVGFSGVYRGDDGIIRDLITVQIRRKIEFEEIDAGKVLDILEYLIKIGVNIGKVVGDSQTLGMFAQTLVKRYQKDRVDYVSVDRSTEPYMVVLFLAKRGLLKFRYHKIERKEFGELIYYKNLEKIDHPQVSEEDGGGATGEENRKGAKDISDSKAMSVYALFVTEGLSTEDLIVLNSVQKEQQAAIEEKSLVSMEKALSYAKTADSPYEEALRKSQETIDKSNLDIVTRMMYEMEGRL